jgi:flagellar protein FliO/FliZ
VNVQHLRRHALEFAVTAFVATLVLAAVSMLSPAHAQTVAATNTSTIGSAVHTPSIWPTLLALIAVVGAIVTFGWVMKKLNPMSAQSGKLLNVVSQLPVGPKERVVVVAFQSQWMVLGVTPTNITLLSTQDAAPTSESTPSNTSTGAPFQALLDRALNRRGATK